MLSNRFQRIDVPPERIVHAVLKPLHIVFGNASFLRAMADPELDKRVGLARGLEFRLFHGTSPYISLPLRLALFLSERANGHSTSQAEGLLVITPYRFYRTI